MRTITKTISYLCAGCLLFIFLMVDVASAQRGISVSTQPQPSDRRVALVIGNAGYKNNPLRNPVNDARLMSRTLKELGFDVVEGHDLDLRAMKRLVQRFGKRLDRGGVGLFYYAGHAVQVNEVNYLIPIGAQIDSEFDVELESFDVRRVLVEMAEARNRLNLIFLDSCRNNPYSSNFRSPANGLAQMNAPSGTLISFATGPGRAAADAAGVDGKHGVFTEELVRHITEPGLMVEIVLKRTRVAVSHRTNGKQIPWDSSSLTGNFYFKPVKNQAAEEKDSSGITKEQKGNKDSSGLPPKIPGTEDLAALKQEAKKKDSWKAWQKSMTAYWNEVTSLQPSSLSPEKKGNAWRGALSKYSEDNPYSLEDDRLRQYAKTRLAYWINQHNKIPQTILNYDLKGKNEIPQNKLQKEANELGWVVERGYVAKYSKKGTRGKIRLALAEFKTRRNAQKALGSLIKNDLEKKKKPFVRNGETVIIDTWNGGKKTIVYRLDKRLYWVEFKTYSQLIKALPYLPYDQGSRQDFIKLSESLTKTLKAETANQKAIKPTVIVPGGFSERLRKLELDLNHAIVKLADIASKIKNNQEKYPNRSANRATSELKKLKLQAGAIEREIGALKNPTHTAKDNATISKAEVSTASLLLDIINIEKGLNGGTTPRNYDKANPTKKMTYTVKRGDSLFSIAARYKTTVSDIKRYNNLTKKFRLTVGQRLVIYK